MTLKNARPRFALESDNGLLYDYLLNKGHKPEGDLVEEEGIWNLAKVKALIDAHLPIESAYTANVAPETAEELRAKLADAEAREEQERLEKEHAERLAAEKAAQEETHDGNQSTGQPGH